MGDRFYMQRENEKAYDAWKKRRAYVLSTCGSKYPFQDQLSKVVDLMPKDKQAFARFLSFAKNLSPKQIEAGKRMVIQMEKVK
jgi:hypothetical protein